MTTITVDLDNEKALIKSRQLATENGWLLPYSRSAIDTITVDAGKKQHLSNLLEDCAKRGGLKSFGEDPSEWQREQRGLC